MHPPQHLRAGRPGRLHHASPGWLPIPGCGIATCPTWAIDTAGLAPAGLQPCRLLPAASGSSTDGFATRRRVPAGPESQAMATAIPKAYLASSAIRCRDVETGPNLGVLAVFPSTGATCRCPLPSTGSRGLNSPATLEPARRSRRRVPHTARRAYRFLPPYGDGAGCGHYRVLWRTRRENATRCRNAPLHCRVHQ